MSKPHLVVIPAHGRGTRLREVTAGRAKTLVEVAGEAILRRLLRAVAAAAASPIVYTQPDDAGVEAFVAASGIRVPVRHREPMGYLRDLMEISRDVGEEFTVLDCDLVAPHTELVRFLMQTRLHVGASMLFAVSATPPSPDPRSIRVTTGPGGALELADPAASHLPRAVGAYHWRAAAVAAGRRFANEEHGTFHGYMELLADRREPVGVIPVADALNVNTPAELNMAAELVGEWRTRGLE